MSLTTAIASLALVALFTAFAAAAIKTETVEYRAGETTCRGYLAYDDAVTAKRPGVIVVHEWWGLNDYPKQRAEQLAQLGYVAFCADMYGDGKTTRDAKEAAALAGQAMKDPAAARARMTAALETIRKQPQVDGRHVGAIGYCFGGGVVLAMARAGMDLDGVVSFHGGLGTQSPAGKGAVKARVLACHGADDTFLTPEEIVNFQKEMTAAGADWQLIVYGGAVHAFTNPNADKAGIPGVAYNQQADHRSWEAMKLFLKDVFTAER